VKRVTVALPEDLHEEVRRISGGRISAWLREVARRAVEEERRKALLNALPEEIRQRLLERAGGNEREAANLALRYLASALEEEEEEEAAQEAIAYANKIEALKERRRKERPSG
jgi:hypothetical protein